MGTRADYYIGRGKDAEWLGSSAWDGYPSGVQPVVWANTMEAFTRAVARRVAKHDGSTPEDGWPWPWDNSRTTDYAYAWDDGRVWVSCFGMEWVPAREWDSMEQEAMDALAQDVAEFPDMSDRKSVTFGPRSGLIVVSG